MVGHGLGAGGWAVMGVVGVLVSDMSDDVRNCWKIFEEQILGRFG